MEKHPKKKDRPSIDRYGRNELINNVIENNFDQVKALILGGTDVNLKDDKGWTALHFASQEFNKEIVTLLLNNGADPNSVDLDGNTPIFRALFNCKGRDTSIFDEFEKFGGNPEIKNTHGVSAIELAEQVTNFDLKKYFPRYFSKKQNGNE
jgi:ankyrin repeat protein